MNKQDAEPGSEENTIKNSLPQDKQGEGTQQVNGSKDTKTGKPFVPNKPLPGDEIVRQHE